MGEEEWDANDMAAAINDVELKGIDIREAARGYGMSEGKYFSHVGFYR